MAARRVAGALPPGLVTRLVGVPQLAAVVAELCVAALAPAAQLGALRAAVGDDGVAAGGRTQKLACARVCFKAGSGVMWVRTPMTSDVRGETTLLLRCELLI